MVSVPTYAYTNYAYQQTLLVPQVIEAAVYAPNHVYSISDGYQSSQVIDAVARLIQKERAAMGQPSQLPAQPVQQPQPLPPVPQPTPQPVPQPVQQPAARPQYFQPSAYQDATLIGLIQQSCVKCHEAQHKMPLLTQDGKALLNLTRQQALTVYWLVNTGAMPKTAPPIEDKYMPLFAKWIEASR